MITTQRVLIILIVLNLLISTIVGMHNDPKIFDTYFIDKDIQRMEDDKQLAESDSGVIDAVRQYAGKLYEATIGNVITWGRILWRLFSEGLKPIGIGEDAMDSNLEKLIVKMINWFRFVIFILMLIEAYLFFKNKKTS